MNLEIGSLKRLDGILVRLFVTIIITGTEFPKTKCSTDKSTTSELSYQELLKLKHAELLRATKTIVAVGDYAKRYKMLTMIYQKMFEVVSDAKLVIESSGYVHGDDFPSNTTVRDALSTTVENALFFGDILLRLPEMTHKILAGKKEWRLTLQWSWQLCNELTLLDNHMRTVLDLAGQELEFIERSPDYINPYAAGNQMGTGSDRNLETDKLLERQMRRKKKNKSKGPHMSSSNLGEL